MRNGPACPIFVRGPDYSITPSSIRSAADPASAYILPNQQGDEEQSVVAPKQAGTAKGSAAACAKRIPAIVNPTLIVAPTGEYGQGPPRC